MFTKRIRPSAAVCHDPLAGRALRWLQFVALCCAVAGMQPAVAAEKLGASDRAAIEQTIRRQLDAFTHDDADGAFRFATPDIRRMFGSSDNFLQMVRENYEPVYRSSGVSFVALEVVDGQWVQGVQIVDGEGKVWRALFTMKRQPDKSWKVGGCQLVQTSAIAT